MLAIFQQVPLYIYSNQELSQQHIPDFVRNCGKPLVDLVIANEAVEDVEAPLYGEVDHGALVLGDGGLVGEGEEVHEEEHQQMQRLPVHFLDIQTLHRKVLVIKTVGILRIIVKPKSNSKSQIQVQNPSHKFKSKKLKSKVQRKRNGTGADTIILQATTPPPPPHQ